MTGLYIHIPFCLQKCKYCDFISFTNSKDLHSNYISSLAVEMKRYENEKVDTIFIGGGTPTELSDENLSKLLEFCNSHFDISDNVEFSIEANPKTLTDSKLDILKKGGVNRLSIGVQSFLDDELLMIGRIHSAEEAYNTVCKAQSWGFNNINIDLMSALPYQNLDKFKYSLETALYLNIPHISCYSLILEHGTLLEKEYSNCKFEIPNEDEDREIYAYLKEILKENGYNQYEISNFAKSGFECRHNIKYWQCREYIGLGVAAHSYYKGERYCNTNDLSTYIAGDGYNKEKTVLSENDKIEEFMIMGLRMTGGISERDFYNRFGQNLFDVYKKELTENINNGLLIHDKDRVYLTDKGINISNYVLCDFML